MTWWRNAWWIRVDNGSHMRSARGRRKTWQQPDKRPNRSATETGSERLEGDTKESERQNWEEKRKEATLHQVLHVSTAATTTAATATATAAAATPAGTAATAASFESPARLCFSLCILRLALRCTMSGSLHFRSRPTCTSSSTCEMSQMSCGHSGRFLLTWSQRVVRRGSKLRNS